MLLKALMLLALFACGERYDDIHGLQQTSMLYFSSYTLYLDKIIFPYLRSAGSW